MGNEWRAMPAKFGLTMYGSPSYSTICSTMLRERPGKCCLTTYAAWKRECAATACWCDPNHDHSQIRVSNESKSASKPLRMTPTMQTANYKPAQLHAQHRLFIEFHRASYFYNRPQLQMFTVSWGILVTASLDH